MFGDYPKTAIFDCRGDGLDRKRFFIASSEPILSQTQTKLGGKQCL